MMVLVVLTGADQVIPVTPLLRSLSFRLLVQYQTGSCRV